MDGNLKLSTFTTFECASNTDTGRSTNLLRWEDSVVTKPGSVDRILAPTIYIIRIVDK